MSRSFPIDENFFCDGHAVVLMSQSLANSGIDPHQLSDWLASGDDGAMQDLLRRGVCLPVFFGTDCALDGATRFFIGDMDAPYEKAWVAKLTGKLSIPCGKLVLLCGGGSGEELALAISGQAPDPDYCIYQAIDVPPADYRVDLFAYRTSPTVGLYHEDLDDDELEAKYRHLPAVDEAYVVRLSPLKGDVPVPALVDEVGWPGVFEFRAA